MSEFQEILPKLKLLAKEYNIHNNFDHISSKIIKHSETEPGNIRQDDININKTTHNLPCNLFNSFCFDFWNFLMISPNGDIQFCLREHDYGINIKKDRLKEVWHGKKLNSIRKMFLKGDKFDECNTCCPPKMIEILDLKNEMLRQI